VAIAYKKSDGTYGFPRKTVMECWHSYKGLIWLERVNNRTILPFEIVLDIDDDKSEKNMNRICDSIDKYGLSYKAYFSGSKGYHVHIHSKVMAEYSKLYRERIREFLIKKFDCDGLKKRESHLIALEDCPHWRTGNMKTLVRCNGWALKK